MATIIVHSIAKVSRLVLAAVLKSTLYRRYWVNAYEAALVVHSVGRLKLNGENCNKR